jgi:hypothetical protein
MREVETAERSLRRDELRRQKRRQATTYRRRRIRLAVGFTIFCLVIAGVLIAAFASGTTEQVSAQKLLVDDGPASSAAVAATGEARPVFARLGDRNIVLPVAAGDATIIAYQPVSDERAVALNPIGEQANSSGIVRFFRGILSGDAPVRYYMLDGDGGEATSSVLVGAASGSPVTAPVSGVVTGVKQYKLYGKYDDVQVDIRPEGMSGTTVSIMFLSDVSVSIGEVLSAGKTELGKVRACPADLGSVLSPYTHDSGDHVHMIVTQEPVS